MMSNPLPQLEPIDLDALPAECRKSRAILERLAKALDEQLADQTPLLARGIAEKDAPGVARLAHSLKGAAAAIHAEHLRRISALLEAAAKEDALDQAAVLLPELREEGERCLAYFRHVLSCQS